MLPAATEIVYLLGLEKFLVGVSHECDYPPQVRKVPKVTSSPISNQMSSLEIDQEVKKIRHKGPGVFHINKNMLKRLKPDLIISQELCEVCAVGFNQIKKAARILDGDVKIISLEPESVEDILENILLIGESSGKSLESRKIVKALKNRLKILDSRLSVLATIKKPKVCVVEWLDPLMVAGHWVPEMVEVAGGQNLISKKGEKSRYIQKSDLFKSSYDIVIIAPCGFDIQRTIKEKQLIQNILDREYNGKIYLIDGNSYMTRPGPRIMDGIEILSEIIHPEIFPRKHLKKDWQCYNLN